MGPEIHFQVMISRNAELREEAAAHRRAREVEAARKARSAGERRRGLRFFGKPSAA
ncbi:hypothetical protein [Planomonospora sp. ID82291]|uniref:hypothetical protein n=1 Tax=Planomonospora sp. ID82291 TaxID=2738136 RepID=UPI0018C415AF|nr:hypothetical protein [Planomonospora sp. ID82291]MBG0813851.1 hypothetical protein [Planomonospora sp. ID82291]